MTPVYIGERSRPPRMMACVRSLVCVIQQGNCAGCRSRRPRKEKTGPGDSPEPVFSFLGRRDLHPAQLPCWITHTNERTHAIIRGGLDRSPMYTGVIAGVGERKSV